MMFIFYIIMLCYVIMMLLLFKNFGLIIFIGINFYDVHFYNNDASFIEEFWAYNFHGHQF